MSVNMTVAVDDWMKEAIDRLVREGRSVGRSALVQAMIAEWLLRNEYVEEVEDGDA